jgi:thiaminase/transcriptional activator TenA
LHEHPFIREVAAGTLPHEKFRFYLEQNLLYLPEYARAIALGAAKAGDLEELGQFAEALANIVETEIPKDRELLDRVLALGAEDRGGTRAMAPATLAYTSYLLSTAFRGGPLEIMTAIMPCAWSYGEIASRLRPDVGDHPVYAGWVGFFASDEYEVLVDELREQLDAMGSDASRARRRELATIFDMSGRLEHGFWEMAYGLVQWPDLMEERTARSG